MRRQKLWQRGSALVLGCAAAVSCRRQFPTNLFSCSSIFSSERRWGARVHLGSPRNNTAEPGAPAALVPDDVARFFCAAKE